MTPIQYYAATLKPKDFIAMMRNTMAQNHTNWVDCVLGLATVKNAELNLLFNWQDTPEGHEYWAHIHASLDYTLEKGVEV